MSQCQWEKYKIESFLSEGIFVLQDGKFDLQELTLKLRSKLIQKVNFAMVKIRLQRSRASIWRTNRLIGQYVLFPQLSSIAPYNPVQNTEALFISFSLKEYIQSVLKSNLHHIRDAKPPEGDFQLSVSMIK